MESPIKEVWRKITVHPGDYLCSNKGRIQNRKGMILKPAQHYNGYTSVKLCFEGVKKSIGLHRVIAFTWKSNPHDLPEVGFINGIKSDCRPENLKWSSVFENRRKTGLGVKDPLTKSEIKIIKKLLKTKTQAEIGKMFNRSQQCIFRVSKL